MLVNVFGSILDYNVFDDAPNYSDRLPVVCSVRYDVFQGTYTVQRKGEEGGQVNNSGYYRCDKANLEDYYAMTGDLLQRIHIPYDLLCTDCNAFNCTGL